MQQAISTRRSFIFGNEDTSPATPPHTESTGSGASEKSPLQNEQDRSEGYAYFHPQPKDVVYVKRMLAKATRLPVDLIDGIFDFAEYWASSTNEVDFIKEHGTALRINGTGRLEDKFLIRSFPVGLTGIDGRQKLRETLAYDLNEAKPRPLGREHEAAYFAKLTDHAMPRLVHPVRKIVFSIKSKDQGWGGNRQHGGTFKSSWTWFEAGLERFDADQICESHCPMDSRYESPNSVASSLPLCAIRPIHPEFETLRPETNIDETQESVVPRCRYIHELHRDHKWEIQRNKSATKDFQEHIVTWRWTDDIDPDSEEGQHLDDIGRGKQSGTGEVVRSLKMGDVVSVWGKARFPGWTNIIEKVKVDVYWAI